MGLCTQLRSSNKTMRSQVVEALLQLVHHSAGEIVSPKAIAAVLLLDGCDNGSSSTTWWQGALAVLRALLSDHEQAFVSEQDIDMPGAWLHLQRGFVHTSAAVRCESLHVYSLSCKAHAAAARDDSARQDIHASWLAALRHDLPVKTLTEARQLLECRSD